VVAVVAKVVEANLLVVVKVPRVAKVERGAKVLMTSNKTRFMVQGEMKLAQMIGPKTQSLLASVTTVARRVIVPMIVLNPQWTRMSRGDTQE
jgi:hypothetical protein